MNSDIRTFVFIFFISIIFFYSQIVSKLLLAKLQFNSNKKGL